MKWDVYYNRNNKLWYRVPAGKVSYRTQACVYHNQRIGWMPTQWRACELHRSGWLVAKNVVFK